MKISIYGSLQVVLKVKKDYGLSKREAKTSSTPLFYP